MCKKFFIAIAGVLICFIIFQACVYNKADEQYPSSGSCDTGNVRYSVEIKSILDANCKTCHNGASSISGINLYDHAVIAAFATDNAFTYGTLLSAIMHKGGAPFMPEDNTMLQQCDINKIAAWVHAGAPDN